MLLRFSLYGFLKNQLYFAPFIILAFRAKGLTFFQIGLLMGFQALLQNALEIPSGALADIYGRRRSMIFSFLAFILAFGLLGLLDTFALLFIPMFFWAIGDAFRTGTHKAMIFHWLEREGRLNERTKTYGYTRSWSKIGSALSTIIAVILVFYTRNYEAVFWFAIIPYVLGIINFLGYPAWLDAGSQNVKSTSGTLKFLWDAIKESFVKKPLRRVLAESMCFEGIYKTAENYVQPVIQTAVLALPFFTAIAGQKRTALAIGILYFAIHIVSSFMSRHAHRVEVLAGSPEKAASSLWAVTSLVYAAIFALFLAGWNMAAALCFILLALLENIWRPITITRINSQCVSNNCATILSIESQSKSLFVAVAAPVLGYGVDKLGFWPIGAMGMFFFAIMYLWPKPADRNL